MTRARAADSVEAVFREERGRLLAMLVRQFGDLDLAEDATIETVLERWLFLPETLAHPWHLLVPYAGYVQLGSRLRSSH